MRAFSLFGVCVALVSVAILGCDGKPAKACNGVVQSFGFVPSASIFSVPVQSYGVTPFASGNVQVFATTPAPVVSTFAVSPFVVSPFAVNTFGVHRGRTNVQVFGGGGANVRVNAGRNFVRPFRGPVTRVRVR